MLDALRISKYRFTLEAGANGLELPPFKTSAFRGGFGRVFKALTCAFPGKECTDCSIQHSCPYIYVFETKPPVNSKVAPKFESVPRPYVISSEFDGKRFFKPGEKLSFELSIFGDAFDYVPFFIRAFEMLGSKGIGKERKPYTLHRVEVINLSTGSSFLIYDSHQKHIQHRPIIFTGQKLLDRAAQITAHSFTVTFETPLRMKYNGNYTADPQFHLLIRNALRRVSSLLYFHHGGQELNLDFHNLLRKAEGVKVVTSSARWVDWERFSARQDTKMSLGGIMGEVSYEGDLTPFIPFLLAAEALGIGKQTVFGLGKLHLIWGS
ncbi:hypothetical protein CIG75_05405 [Tumebacillus algifaecis]|uniref:CRISPR-associated protein Cas6 C-terminal domain-containing protein n=1 Tax=Tumebacillus algifaecis TaxID=1214604 RepID=A0A223CZ77_9BACL|nr:CRISPR system precrRNA processing endoribonuclease RAMP protein Cas6 [Tumebacillus algifaecis]ASS74484.1 hypothetical protein CIG75_05405 [Tumebacillus algifaecis]